MNDFGSLASLKDLGYQIHAHCENIDCLRGRQLDLDALIKRFGPDFDIYRNSFDRRLRCTSCGGTRCSVRVLAYGGVPWSDRTKGK